MFTEKCLEILSRKKAAGSNEEHRNKMRQMMESIIGKYKTNLTQKKEASKPTVDFSQLVTQKYNKLNVYEDKIEVYRMIKSTEIDREKNRKTKQLEWKDKPDVTGVRMNKKILKSEAHDIQGVTCFSLPISEFAPFKRSSIIHLETASIERALSSSSSRKRIKISKVKSSQKFMVFNIHSDPDTLYMKKLKSFLDFLFKVNYSNKIYVSLQLSEQLPFKYKVCIGKGNNSLLIKSLLQRRFWLEIVDSDEEEINFFWSQNKINKVHYRQSISSSIKSPPEKVPIQNRKEGRLNEELLELNRKILSPEENAKVERFIQKDGFIVPFEETNPCKMITNHLPQNSAIGSKKNLFRSLYNYYTDHLKINPFTVIPKSYNVKSADDPEFKKFLRENKHHPNAVWIVKPGENSNRGNGISLAEFNEVPSLIKKDKHENGQPKTYIIQSYIRRPFLYNGRKFDIRHFMLLTSVNGILKAYWYREGYLRTSSFKFDIEELDNRLIHLTNDALQKKSESYEKYEPGNKLSYSEFQRYLDGTYPSKGYNFERDIVQKMKMIMLDVLKANYQTLDVSRREANFEIFGFDFMLDHDFRPWLIEINANPCLEMNCHLLERIIPVMVENSLRIGLDPLLPPLAHYPANKRYTLSDNYLRNLRYELLFDESAMEESLSGFNEMEDSDEEEEEYHDEGKEIGEELVL